MAWWHGGMQQAKNTTVAKCACLWCHTFAANVNATTAPPASPPRHHGHHRHRQRMQCHTNPSPTPVPGIAPMPQI